ncbi:MAG: hypothetical protein AAFQ83_06225 [Bacteroidota bacterium]
MKRKILPFLLSGFLLAAAVPLWQMYADGLPLSFRPKIAAAAAADEQVVATMSMTIFPNDSVADMSYCGDTATVDILDTLLEAQFVFDVRAIDFSCIKVIWDESLYTERWDTLAQTQFWRRIMNLPKDSCIVNIASTREIVETLHIYDWEGRTDSVKETYKDSLRLALELQPEAAIYVTSGKSHYYHFDRMLHHIGEAVDIFYDRGVDPWYAQAILLIESPGQLQYSPVGAYGSFQLMKTVAIEQGLVVNDTVDEREIFDRAAWAAAGLIQKRCVPHTRRMLRKRNIAFQEDDLFFRLMVLHAYHAGAGNVEGALTQFEPTVGGPEIIHQLWHTEYGGFKNASQNYSQIALASLMELDRIMTHLPDTICQTQEVIAFNDGEMTIGPTAP